MKVLLTEAQRRANRSASHAKWVAKTATPERSAATAAYQREYRLKNAEVLKAKKAEKYIVTKASVIASVMVWAKANKEKTRASVRKWGKANRAKVNASASARMKATPHIGRAKNAKYQADKLQATPAWANSFFISEAYHLSAIRTKATGMLWHVDHVVPLRSKYVCGLHCEANLRVIPSAENLKKGNRYWPDMP